MTIPFGTINKGEYCDRTLQIRGLAMSVVVGGISTPDMSLERLSA